MDAQREVVRLSLGQGQPTLNVLSAGVEGSRFSVVCPFPVLPLELPVSVTMPGEDERAVSATIRKVKVELAEETEIPRFKLQLELTGEDREGIDGIDGVSIELDEFGLEPEESEDSRGEESTESRGSEDSIDLAAGEGFIGADEEHGEPEDVGPDQHLMETEEINEFNWPPPEDDFELAEDEGDWEGPTEDDEDAILGIDEDPPWVATAMEDTPEGEEDESPRRARWPVRAAVAFGLLVSVVAVAYVLRQQVMAVVSPFVGEQIELAGLDFLTSDLQATPLTNSEERTEDAAEDSAEGVTAPLPPPASALEPEHSQAADQQEAAPEAETAPPELAEGLEEEGEAIPAVEGSGGQIRVTLPTQWPVSEARSYRLHDPTGIVVDVPGGLAAQSARWIDTSHARVRSVRVLERQDGVRFIIYLNDENVPRYRVGYGRTGVTVDILGPDPRHVPS